MSNVNYNCPTDVELNFYKVLAKFSQNAHVSLVNAELLCQQLFDAVNALLKVSPNPSADLIGHLITTINNVLLGDRARMHSYQRRDPWKYEHSLSNQITVVATNILYDILFKLIRFERIGDKVDGTLFPQRERLKQGQAPRTSDVDLTHIYICPREIYYGKWDFESNHPNIPSQSYKGVPFKDVQHVVHTVDDLVSILQSKSMYVHFKARPNLDYHGPPLFWCSPLPALPVTMKNPCPSMNPSDSRYGSFQFVIPFASLFTKYSKHYWLGTRRYKREHAHTIMLTKSTTQSVRLINSLEPLTHSRFFEQLNDTQFYWRCFNSEINNWDHLEFAIADNELIFNSNEIQLDFVDHLDFCVPVKQPVQLCDRCKHGGSRQMAMRRFLTKLHEKNLLLQSFRSIFTDAVWTELELEARAPP